MRPSPLLFLRWPFCFAIVLMTTTAALASDEDDARIAMREGIAAYNRGEYDAALARYEAAKRLAPNANAPFFYAAEALEKLGRYRDAIKDLETYVAKDPNVSDAAQVKARIAQIRAAHIPARVVVIANTEGTVLVDGTEVGKTGSPIEVIAGTHRVEARAPSRAPVSQDVLLTSDEEMRVTLTFGEPLKDPTTPPTPPVIHLEEPQLDGGGAPWRTIGWIAAGAGAATVVTTLIVDAAVLGPKVDDYNAARDSFDPSTPGLRTDVEHLRTGVAASYVIGGVVLLGGVALAIFAPHQKTTTKASSARGTAFPNALSSPFRF